MRIFVSGATTVLGQKLCRVLKERDHHVIGLARTDAGRAMLHAMKVTVYSGQGRDVDRLADALVSTHAIVHLAYTLPNSESAEEDDWPYSSGVVTGMLNHLISASSQSGRRTIVFPSTYAVYGDSQLDWVNEGTRISAEQHSQPYIEAEQICQMATSRKQGSGIVLRMGILYGYGLAPTHALVDAIKGGQAPIIGDGSMYWPLLHVDDAVQALALAAEDGTPGEVYNACDDEPVQVSVLYRYLANQLSATEPEKRTIAESQSILHMNRPAELHLSVRMSNKKIKERLEFSPRYATYKDGFGEVISNLP